MAAYFKMESYEDKLCVQILTEEDLETKFGAFLLEEVFH